MLSKGDVALLVDDSSDAVRARDFAASFSLVTKELGFEPKFYLAHGGVIPRQTESEFLDDVRGARVVVIYLAPWHDAEMEANRASRILLNTSNLDNKHVLAYSNSAASEASWLGVGLKSVDVSDVHEFEAALRRDLKELAS